MEDLLSRLRNGRCSVEECCADAAARGNVTELEAWRELAVLMGFDWDERVTANACLSGKLDVLKYAIDNECPWHTKCLVFAARHKELVMIKYCIENDCPLAAEAFVSAAERGRVETLEYLFTETQCPRYSEFWSARAITNASAKNQFSAVKWLHAHDFPGAQSPVPCAMAARCGNLEMLMWMRANGFHWNYLTTRSTVAVPSPLSFHILRYAHQNGCPIGRDVIYFAAKRGLTDVFQYCVQQGFQLTMRGKAMARLLLYNNRHEELKWMNNLMVFYKTIHKLPLSSAMNAKNGHRCNDGCGRKSRASYCAVRQMCLCDPPFPYTGGRVLPLSEFPRRLRQLHPGMSRAEMHATLQANGIILNPRLPVRAGQSATEVEGGQTQTLAEEEGRVSGWGESLYSGGRRQMHETAESGNRIQLMSSEPRQRGLRLSSSWHDFHRSRQYYHVPRRHRIGAGEIQSSSSSAAAAAASASAGGSTGSNHVPMGVVTTDDRGRNTRLPSDRMPPRYHYHDHHHHHHHHHIVSGGIPPEALEAMRRFNNPLEYEMQ